MSWIQIMDYPKTKDMPYPENLSEKEILLLILKRLEEIEEKLDVSELITAINYVHNNQ